MQREMDAPPGSSQAFPPSSSTTNFSARRRHDSPHSAAQHRRHPYIIPKKRRSADKILSETSHLGHLMPATASRVLQRGGAYQNPWPQSDSPALIFGTSPGVSGPSMADQRRFTSPVTHQSYPLTAPNATPPTVLIPSILIPDLTGLITRCGQDPVSGGTYGNIYRCIYHGPDGNVDVAVKAIRPQFISDEVFRRELGIWKRLRHSNILKFIGTTSDFGPSVALVAPWIANGTLTSFLNQNNETLALLDRLRLVRTSITFLVCADSS
ncbi:hypothetical protein DFH29DRAFT_407640 [Suillus ampliporus]|nr:hypothetical protein DFH29DRAFT_407640 [Suillus ampliporus]